MKKTCTDVLLWPFGVNVLIWLIVAALFYFVIPTIRLNNVEIQIPQPALGAEEECPARGEVPPPYFCVFPDVRARIAKGDLWAATAREYLSYLRRDFYPESVVSLLDEALTEARLTLADFGTDMSEITKAVLAHYDRMAAACPSDKEGWRVLTRTHTFSIQGETVVLAAPECVKRYPSTPDTTK